MARSTTMETRSITRKDIKTWNLSEEGEKLHSDDAVIDAYYKGKEVGLNFQQQLLKPLFEANIQKSADNTEELLQHLSENGFNPKSAHLRIRSIISFEIIILLTEDEFLSDAMQKVYMYCRDLQIKMNSDSYGITFSFTDVSDSFNHDHLNADGFKHSLKLQ